MDFFSLIFQYFSEKYTIETITVFIVAGYWIFFLLFYGSSYWSKDKLDWPERLVLSFILGYFFSVASIFPNIFFGIYFKQLDLNINYTLLWYATMFIELLVITIYRYNVNCPIISNESMLNVLSFPIRSLLYSISYSFIPVLVFGTSLIFGNIYLSEASKYLFFFYSPLMLYLSIIAIQINIFIILIFIPYVINRSQLSVFDKEHFRLSNFLPVVNLFNEIYFQKKVLKKPSKTWDIFILLCITTVLLVSANPILCIFTPKITLIEEKINPLCDDVVIKLRGGDEAYLREYVFKYNIQLPLIPLVNISVRNPSNYTTQIGERVSYYYAFMRHSDNLITSNEFNREENITKIEVDAKWSDIKNGIIELNYYHILDNDKIITFINKTVSTDNKMHVSLFSIDHGNDVIKIDEYYLMRNPFFDNSNISVYLGDRNVTNSFSTWDDWIKIRNLNIYPDDSDMLSISIKEENS